MDGVAISIIGRPRPIPGHDTPNPANNTYTLNYEEPVVWQHPPSEGPAPVRHLSRDGNLLVLRSEQDSGEPWAGAGNGVLERLFQSGPRREAGKCRTVGRVKFGNDSGSLN